MNGSTTLRFDWMAALGVAVMLAFGAPITADAFGPGDVTGALKQQAGDAATDTAQDAADDAAGEAADAVQPDAPSRGGSLTDAAKVGADTAAGEAVKSGNLSGAAKKGGAAGVKEYMGLGAAKTGAAEPAAGDDAGADADAGDDADAE